MSNQIKVATNPRAIPGSELKRYNISFNQKNFEAFQEMFRCVGAPAKMPSLILDNFIRACVEKVGIEAEVKGRQLGLTELLNLIDVSFVDTTKDKAIDMSKVR